jgi:hypothetical protein
MQFIAEHIVTIDSVIFYGGVALAAIFGARRTTEDDL